MHKLKYTVLMDTMAQWLGKKCIVTEFNLDNASSATMIFNILRKVEYEQNRIISMKLLHYFMIQKDNFFPICLA